MDDYKEKESWLMSSVLSLVLHNRLIIGNSINLYIICVGISNLILPSVSL